MAKQLNVNLAFKADTSQAKSAIMDLQQSLSKVSSMNINTSGLNADKLKAASSAAKELSIHLNNAFNVQTGNFDLSKLDRSLKTSSTNITELSSKLLGAGANGKEAFVKLAQSISAADRPVVTLNGKLNEMFTALKNAARWQISSSVLHGFMGAVQQAYRYAQDLNESLTNIRIVTGQNMEQMSKFAIEANKAAKALSTTTTKYTNASLIYYQQGLSDAEVAKRTEVTIKMANAAGQSAQMVSDQLTAIWNNFYDGSKSLEYYADVMTALGAATASSTDEIAGGLEKFAAIGETIGLSYEYAASALATITSNTRQSEEVVGTALKTIFARIQGLNLGETLDDGTTLNKYSEALQSVGISIFDQAGELKNMDNILNEMADKWDILSKAQQVALAQTVAGVRQYTQLVSLMDNWDNGDSDSMIANLDTAYNSAGTLQEQADIYAESWEAARDRVKASLETIYNQLLDDEFFIDLSNGFSHLLDSVSAFIDGIGGVKTILGTIFTFFLSSISTKIEPALHQLRQNFEIIFTGSSKSAKKMAEEMQVVSMAAIQNPKNKFSDSDRLALESSTKMSMARNKMFDVEKDLSPLEKQQYEMELQILEIEQKNLAALQEQIQKKKEAVSLAQEELQLAKKKVDEVDKLYDAETTVTTPKAVQTRDTEEQHLHNAYTKAKANDAALQTNPKATTEEIMKSEDAVRRAQQAWFGHMGKTEAARLSLEKLGEKLKDTYTEEMKTTNGILENSKAFVSVAGACSEYTTRLSNMSKQISGGKANIESVKASALSMRSEIEMATGGLVDFSKEFTQIETATNGNKLSQGFDALIKKMEAAGIEGKELEKALNKLGQGKYTKAMSSGFSEIVKKTKAAEDAAKRHERAIAKLKKAQDELNEKFNAFNPQHKAKALESFAKAGAGLGKLASSITMIRSAFVALQNEDLSFGEKLTTVTMSLTMAVPMLTSGLTTLKTGLAGLNSAFGMTMAVQKLAGLTMLQQATNTEILTGKITAQQIAQRTGLTLDQAEVLLNQRQAAAILLEAQAEGTLGGAKMNTQIAEKLGISVKQAGLIISAMKKGASLEEAAAEQGVTIAKSKGIVASIANTAAKLAETIGTKMKSVADKGETAGIWAKVAAYIAEQAAAWPVLVVTLLIVAAIASLAAIVFVAVKAIQAMVRTYNADAIAAENAANAAKKLGEAYDECKQEYQDMISTMENYKSARDGLDDLIEGTVEYQEALNKANEAALELIEIGNLIKGQDYTIDNGEIIISDSAMENAKEIKFKEVQDAQAASIMANATAAQAEAKSNQTNLVRENNINVSYASLGGVPGTVTASTINANQDAIENSKINELIALYDQIGAAAFDSATLQELGFDTANKAYIDSVKEVVKETHAAAEQMENASELASVAILKTDEIYQNSEHQDKIAGAAKKDYLSEYKKAYEAAIEQTTNDDWFGIGSKENKEAMDKYAEQMGLNKLKGFKITNFKQGGNVEYEYFDGDQKKVVEVTQQEIAAKLATTEASDKLAKQTSILSDMFNTLENSSNKANQALADFASGDLFEASKSEFEKMKADLEGKGAITEDENGNYVFDDSETLDYINDNFTIDQLKAMGYDTAEEAAAAFKQQFEANLKAWDSLELPQNLTGGLGDMSLNTAKALESQLKQIKLGPLGEEGAQEYINGLNKMLESEGLDTEEQQQALGQLTKIDWSDWDAMKQAEEILESFGATIDTDLWSEFTDEMRKANNAIPDFSSLITELTAVNEILGDLKFGSIIKDEDYQKLIDYNKEWEHLFVLQSDGSRKFIGNAQQMQAMTKQSLQESRKELAENKKHADALNALEESGTQIFYTDAEIEKMAGGDGKDGLFSFVDSQNNKTQAAEMLEGISGYKVENDGKVTKETADGGTEEVTQEQASAMVMAIQRGNTAEEIILNNKAVQDALKANNYDENTWKEIIGEAKQGNSDRLEVMMGSLETIATQNYEQLDQEYDQMIAANATSVQELQSLAEKGQISTQSYKQQLTSLAQEASSLTELQSIQNAGVIDPDSGEKIKLNTYEYGQALSNLAENYENCEDKITAYNNAVASGDPKAIAAAQSQLELGVAVGEAAEEYDLEAEAIEAQAKQMQKTYNISEKEAVQLTIQNQRMNKGVSELVDNWEDWSEVLTTSNNTSQDWTETTSECTKAVAELVGASKDLELPDEFFKAPENLELLKEAAQGSEEAINELGLAVAETQVDSMKFAEGMTGLTPDDIINKTEFQGWQDTITTGIDNLQTSLDTLGVNEDVFEKLGGDDWVNALNEMAIATEMSVEEMNNLLNTMGVQAEVSTTTKDTKIWVPTYTTRSTTNADGTTTTEVVSQELKEIDGQIEVAQINTGENIGDKPKIRFTGNGSVSSSAKQGSKSSKPKKADKVKKDDIVERYKEVEDSLSQVAEAMEDANRAMDRLYGVSRLKQMEKQNELLEDEVDLLKEKKKQALNYLNEDHKALNAAAKEAGVELNIDENGFITNYTEAMTELYKELDAAINAANADGNADESESERIDAAQKRVDELKSAIDQYDETRDMVKDLDNQLDEKFFEWQDNNAEMLSYKLELNLEINEMDLENIEYELNKIADDFYKMAEAAALMVGTDDSSTDNNQLSIYIRALDDYTAQQKALEEAYAAGEISQAAYVEGMKEVKSGIYDNLASLQELDKSMMEYYGNTLDMAAEEIAEYTDRMDHQVSVLDHYSSLLEIMGKQNDYKTMHKALEAKAQVISDQVAVAKNTMEMYQGQAESRFNEYQDALARGDEKAAELYLKQYEAALAAANEAQDAYLSKAEEWAEALKAVLENKLADIGQTLENALTGGTSFDTISTSMERANSLQEEYLTTTNKIYETNKLISSAQQEIDKSTNLAAKRKLRSFQDETSILQSQGKLSKFELEIQQAKYDLLLAEIALEDARNAKDTVRLRRDSEGNFGYVYTADENKVNEAEQNALDKENALYNIRLEGANEYTEKYQQTMQEMYDTLQDLTERYHNGEFESEEEYRQAMEDARAYYYQKLTDYSQLYTEAIGDDVRIMEDAWSTEFGYMTENTDEWMKAVDVYVSEVEMVFNDYQEKMNQIAVETGTSLDVIENGIKDVVDESESLRDILIGEDGLISAFDDQIDAVATITSHYATLRESLQTIVKSYEDVGKAADEAIKKQQQAVIEAQQTQTKLAELSGQIGQQGEVVKPEGNVKKENPVKPVKPPEPPTDPVTSSSPPPEIRVYWSPSPDTSFDTVTADTISSVNAAPITRNTYGQEMNSPMFEIIYTSPNNGKKSRGYITNKDYLENKKYKDELASLDTGGYTGSWGQSGKLAMLHEKELVLNSNDTTNFLTSLEILRKIVKAIDLQAMNAQIGGMLTMPNIGFTPNEMLEQQVHIEASFPGVSDRNEIEEAFKTLVNRASQFANRKNF